MPKKLIVWVVSVSAAAAISAAVTAQVQSDRRIVSGGDIGFRIEGKDMSGNPTGTLVVRVNGEWLPAVPAGGLRRASQ